jgi:hypothetical protein
MFRPTLGFPALLLCTALCFLPSPAQAQSETAIAGTVTDTTGAIMPGVTIEVSSPALIEGVRAAVTDGQGRYNVTNLRPGTYTVTFTLAGFSIVKREGIVLNAGFTAPVNAQMKVGSLEETVTVTGASPTVDVQNVRTQNTLTRAALDSLPNAQTLASFSALTLGAVFGGSTTQDVGGTAGEGGDTSVHNSRSSDQKFTMEGMNTNNAMGTNGGIWHAGQHYNMEGMQEATMAFNGMNAETETAGLQVNFVPKDGGNTFTGSGRATFTNGRFQASNLTDELRARGASTPGKIKRIYDYGGALGGPVKRDSLWFFTSHRWWGDQTYQPGSFYNRVQGTGLYEPDLTRPGYLENYNQDNSVRLTWQVSRKDKVAYYGNRGDQCVCYLGVGATLAPESATHNATPKNHLSQFTFNRVQTSKVLIEGGFTYLRNPFGFPHHSGVTTTDIPRTEISTGFTWNARTSIQLPYTDYEGPGGGLSAADQTNMRGSLSYVTGSHTFKTGFSQAHGWVEQNGQMNELAGFGPVSFRLLNGRPNGVVVYASPKYSRSDFRNTSFYLQDQWTMNPLTLSMGVRFDLFDGWTPEQTTPAGVFVPAFTVAKIEHTPTWRDVSPRLGIAYDLSGDGKTALKAAAGRYVASAGAGIVQNANPILAVVTSATRTWNDVDNDFFPDAAELGPLSDLAFGTPRISTRYDDDVFLDNRAYTWQMSASLERELRGNMGLTVSYFRTAHFNQTTTDNTLVQSSDFDQYCVTVPSDARLPNGGQQLCGLYNVSFARAGQTNNVVRSDKNFGDETEVYHGMDAQVSARFTGGASVQGGFSIGRTVRDTCFVVDSPQALHFCHVVTPIARNGQIKASGVLPLPFGIEAAAVYQFLPGAVVLANGVFTNAQIAPSLGRNLSNCPAPTGACNATVTVAMIEPNTVSEKHINQLDFRLAKLLRGPFGRVRATLDLYNVLNVAAVLGRNNTFGSAWGTPTRILGGRLIKLGAQYSF